MVADGLGIAPLLSIIERVASVDLKDKSITLIGDGAYGSPVTD